MRLEEVKEIIKSEGLEDYNINLDHEIEAGEIVIVGRMESGKSALLTIGLRL